MKSFKIDKRYWVIPFIVLLFVVRQSMTYAQTGQIMVLEQPVLLLYVGLVLLLVVGGLELTRYAERKGLIEKSTKKSFSDRMKEK